MALKLLHSTNVNKLIICLLLVLTNSCKSNISINKQYLPINKASEKQVFFEFYARGGERHLSLIDWGEDALPTSAGSCHHGGEILPPQKGSIKAYSNDKNLYLDIYWEDKTKDTKSTVWDEKNKKWYDGKDDGIAIIFSDNPQFDCTTTCHMTNWQVGENKFNSDYRMFTKDNSEYPLILIRTKKTGNKPVLILLGKEGKETPNHEPIYYLNSEKFSEKPLTLQTYQIIQNADKPKYRDNKSFFILNPNNLFLNGYMEHLRGRWHAQIEVPLEKINMFLNKRNDKIFMAIAIFDNTHANHSITKTFYATYE